MFSPFGHMNAARMRAADAGIRALQLLQAAQTRNAVRPMRKPEVKRGRECRCYS
jgi:hypothetical protein